MNALLQPLRQIARDLVEKRLWPVAVLLLVALVALPVVIGSSDSAPPPPAPVASATPGTPAAQSLVTMAEPAVSAKQDRPGKVSDPFYDPPAPAAAAASAVTATASAPDDTASTGGSAGAATPAGGSAGGATPAAGGPAAGGADRAAQPVREPAAAKRRRQPAASVGAYYRTVVRWRTAAGGTSRTIERLTPLGDRVAPAALYLGTVKTGATYAVFLLTPNATSRGEATCKRATACRIIGLRAGESQIISVRPSRGGAQRHFELHVRSVRAVTTRAATARRMRARVHRDGRDVMRAMWRHSATAAALEPLRYDANAGTLYFERAATAGAKASE